MFFSALRLNSARPQVAMLLTDSHNSMAQSAKSLLEKNGYQVSVEIARGVKAIEQGVKRLQPDLIVCPFLTKRVPESVWKQGYPIPHRPCIIVHPGVQGDKGMSAIDWALEKSLPQGVTCLSAIEAMDAGPVWATRVVNVSRADPATLTKSSVYKHEIIEAAMEALQEAVGKVQSGELPMEVRDEDPATLGTLLPTMTDEERAVDFGWTADDIVRKVAISDGQPGARVRLNSHVYHAFDAWADSTSRLQPGSPGVVVGARDGALAVSCGPSGENVVWFGHLKGDNGIKLKATEVFKGKVPNHYGNLADTVKIHWATAGPANWFRRPVPTYMELWTQTVDRVGYVVSEFYNGAMSTKQCVRLAKAIRKLRYDDGVDAIVITGGYNAFSNGINLNTIEVAADPARESWENINAINDVVREMFLASDKVVIAALRGNAGAGGCMLALAADIVWAHENVTLNPHYKAMGLHGSEYWTHFLPKRVGERQAKMLTDSKQALSARDAFEIKMLDEVFEPNVERFQRTLHAKVIGLLRERGDILRSKKEYYTEARVNEIEACRQRELDVMKDDFSTLAYESARRNFVGKKAPRGTPIHLTCQRGHILQVKPVAKAILKQLKHQVEKCVQAGVRVPSLALVGMPAHSNSDLHFPNISAVAEEIGVQVHAWSLPLDDAEMENGAIGAAAEKIRQWNTDHHIDGIVIQPFTNSKNTEKLSGFISPLKDVACFNAKHTICASPIPTAILRMLLAYAVPLAGQTAVVLGAESSPASAVASLLKKEGCHTLIIDVQASPGDLMLHQKLVQADIIISAAGVPNVVRPDMVKDGVVIIDAGVSCIEGQIYGDVNPRCESVASLFSSVPDGVGPMTVACLLQNLVRTYTDAVSTGS